MTQDKADDGTDGWPTKLRVGLLVLGILVGAIVAPVVLAQLQAGQGTPVSGEVPVGHAPDGPAVTTTGDLEVDFGVMFPDDNTVDLRTTEGNATFTSQGRTDVRVTSITGTMTELGALDVASNDLTVDPEDKPALTVGGGADSVSWRDPTVDDGVADLSYSASSSATITLRGLPADQGVKLVDTNGNVIGTTTTDGSGAATFSSLPTGTYDAEVVTGDPPELSNPQPADGATISEYETNLSIDVSDPDFTAAGGDNVTVTFWNVDDGTQIHQETVSANGTVTTTWSGLDMGANTWNVTAEDEFGSSTDVGPFEVVTPSELEIRDEQSLELVDEAGANLTVRFFGDDGDTTVSRTTDDGTVNLTGLPADERLFVQTDAEGYYPRTTVIESIVEQQSAYLVNENATVVQNTFLLDDETGAFQSRDTILLIEGLIETPDGDEEYRVIAGDEFGADAQVNTRLIADARYQITVLNNEGDRRSLGSYTAADSGTVTLSVGEVQWGTPEESGYTFDVEKISGGDEIEVQFNATEPPADELTIRIVERFGDTVIYENTVTDTQQFQTVVPLNESEQGVAYSVEYTLERGGETTQGTVLVSGDQSVSTSLPTVWMTTISMIAIVVVSALFTGQMSSYGGIATVSVAGLLMILGWAPIPTYAWFVAGFIAVGGYVRAHEGATP